MTTERTVQYARNQPGGGFPMKMEFAANRFCASCGHEGLWLEHGYPEGSLAVCTHCRKEHFLPFVKDISDEMNDAIEQLGIVHECCGQQDCRC